MVTVIEYSVSWELASGWKHLAARPCKKEEKKNHNVVHAGRGACFKLIYK